MQNSHSLLGLVFPWSWSLTHSLIATLEFGHKEWLLVPGDKIKNQNFWVSGQNQLYHTPLLSKIWDLNDRKKLVNNPFKALSVWVASHTPSKSNISIDYEMKSHLMQILPSWSSPSKSNTSTNHEITGNILPDVPWLVFCPSLYGQRGLHYAGVSEVMNGGIHHDMRVQFFKVIRM